MVREMAAKVYLDGLLLKNVDIGKFFEAARMLSKDDRTNIQAAVEKFRMNIEDTQRKEVMKDKCLVI